MKEEIKKVIQEILSDMKVEANFIVENPTDISNGDFSTNVAMALSKELKESPSSIADKIIEDLNKKELKNFSKIEKAGAGFINFYLSDEKVQSLIEKPVFENDSLKGQEVLLEFTDPNPFKQCQQQKQQQCK